MSYFVVIAKHVGGSRSRGDAAAPQALLSLCQEKGLCIQNIKSRRFVSRRLCRCRHLNVLHPKSVTRSLTGWMLLFLSLRKLLPCFSLFLFLSLFQCVCVLHSHWRIPVVSNARIADGCSAKAVFFVPQCACHLDWGSWIVSLRLPKVFCHSEENVLAAQFGRCDLKVHISWIRHPLCFITVLFLHAGRCRYESFKTNPAVLFICHLMSARLTNWDVLVLILNLENDTMIFCSFQVSFQSHNLEPHCFETHTHTQKCTQSCTCSTICS